MNARDRLVYRSALAAAAVAAAAVLIAALFAAWTVAAIAAAVWMAAVAALVHAQTRMVNAGTRALRDTVRGGSTTGGTAGTAAVDLSTVTARLDHMTEDLALVRAHAEAAPAEDEVRDDLVRLAQSVRREVRLLQYSITVAGKTSADSRTDPGPAAVTAR